MKWYLCTLCYAKKTDEMKKGMAGMILYNKRNTYYFRSHVITAYKMFVSHFVFYIDGRPKIVAHDDAPSLDGSTENPLSRKKMTTYESSCTIVMAYYFLRKKVIVLIILIRYSMRITW